MKSNKMPIGYGIVQTAVMKLKISIQSKSIYCLLASYTGNKDYCFPSIKTIAEDLCITEKLVYKYMKELKENNLIIVSKLYNDSRNNHKYEICFIDNEQHIQDDELPPVENDNVGSSQNKPFINNNSINNNSINNNDAKASKLLSDTFYQFLLQQYDKDSIDKYIYKNKKEIRQYWNFLKQFKDKDELNYFLDKIKNDKWLQSKNFLPSFLINQIASVMLDSKGKIMTDEIRDKLKVKI